MVKTQEYKGMVFEGCAKGKAKVYVYTQLCKGCGLCLVKCPINKKGEEGLKWSKEVGLYATPAVEPNPEKCIGCGICENTCPDSAIRIEKV
jgi:2-oxoglutarate ferredoxin oxidoreductase subunit delta